MSRNPRRLVMALVTCLGGNTGTAGAEQVSILQSALFTGDRRPLIQPSRPAQDIQLVKGNASLFAGTSGTSLFAPYPERPARQGPQAFRKGQPGQAERIRHLIGLAEAGRLGYDAVQHAAKIRPEKRPTQMTIQEIFDWIDRTPGQQHAIGRYQFIPKTLKRLVKKLKIVPGALFEPRLQDRLGDALLVEAGLHAFSSGIITRHTFMNNLAKIWAGLPKSNGKSHYHGFAGNRATMSWTRFDREMAKIFPS